MKLLICQFITKNEIILTDTKINYNNICIGHLINIPQCEFIQYHIEYINYKYNIYGVINTIKLNDRILNENLLYRKELFRLLRNRKESVIIKKEFKELMVNTPITYTVDDYVYLNDYIYVKYYPLTFPYTIHVYHHNTNSIKILYSLTLIDKQDHKSIDYV